jgi:two-component sensor histidine kinase
LLVKTQGEGADLAHVLHSEVAPYDQSRIAAEGPQVLLEPNLAFTMALLFHELATNAAKYGALSAVQGRVDVHWSLTDNRLDLEWRETGGPPVQKPERRGFGTQLVTSALGAFGGKARAHFEPTGLIVRMQIDLANKRLRVVEQKTSPARDLAV